MSNKFSTAIHADCMPRCIEWKLFFTRRNRHCLGRGFTSENVTIILMCPDTIKLQHYNVICCHKASRPIRQQRRPACVCSRDLPVCAAPQCSPAIIYTVPPALPVPIVTTIVIIVMTESPLIYSDMGSMIRHIRVNPVTASDLWPPGPVINTGKNFVIHLACAAILSNRKLMQIQIDFIFQPR